MSNFEIWPIRNVPATWTHCFNLHPRPLLASLQPAFFGQGSCSLSYLERAQEKSGHSHHPSGVPTGSGVASALWGPPPHPGRLHQPQWLGVESRGSYSIFSAGPQGVSVEDNWASSQGCAHTHTHVRACTHTHTSSGLWGSVWSNLILKTRKPGPGE